MKTLPRTLTRAQLASTRVHAALNRRPNPRAVFWIRSTRLTAAVYSGAPTATARSTRLRAGGKKPSSPRAVREQRNLDGFLRELCVLCGNKSAAGEPVTEELRREVAPSPRNNAGAPTAVLFFMTHVPRGIFHELTGACECILGIVSGIAPGVRIPLQVAESGQDGVPPARDHS